MTSFRYSIATTLAAVALMALASPPAYAQAADAEPPAAAPQITDQQLQSYAVAALQVEKVNKTYQPMINKAPTREEQKTLYDKAAQEMVEVIRNSGLSVEQYNQITTLVQSNPELSKQVQGYMDKNR